MTDSPIGTDHLLACGQHGVVKDHDAGCPCCEVGVEARPAALSDASFGEMDVRWQVEPETMHDLLRALQRDAVDQDLGPVYVAVGEVPEQTIRGMAGYTVQERWFNVAVTEVGPGSVDVVKREQDAQNAIATIADDYNYLEPQEPAEQLLRPDEWEAVVAAYPIDVSFTRSDDGTTLTMEASGFRSDSMYSKFRREIGTVATNAHLDVRTIEAGGRFDDAVVEVSIPGDGGD